MVIFGFPLCKKCCFKPTSKNYFSLKKTSECNQTWHTSSLVQRYCCKNLRMELRHSSQLFHLLTGPGGEGSQNHCFNTNEAPEPKTKATAALLMVELVYSSGDRLQDRPQRQKVRRDRPQTTTSVPTNEECGLLRRDCSGSVTERVTSDWTSH